MADYSFVYSEAHAIHGREITPDKDSNHGQTSSYRISLRFDCKIVTIYRDLVANDVSRDEVEVSYGEEKELPCFIPDDIEVSFKEKRHKRAYSKIHDSLWEALVKNYPIPDSDAHKIIESLIEDVKETLDRPPKIFRKGFKFHCPVDTEVTHTFERVLSSDGGDYNCMVPTSDEAIKMLKRKRVEEFQAGEKTINTCCMICLEEIERDSEVCSLPCSHVFHGDCIITWLNTSHYYPICPYEMPVKRPNSTGRV